MSMTQTQRAAFAAFIATTNSAHITLWCEETGVSPEPFRKLNAKVLSFLRGELRSMDNLMRFFDAFQEWRAEQHDNDTLNYAIAELCSSALYASVEALADPECDDTALLEGAIMAIYDDIAELGGDAEGLRDYYRELKGELFEVVAEKAQRPLGKNWDAWLNTVDVSLFGLEQ